MKTEKGTSTPKVLITAGAQAAAQGLVKTALLTKLLPFAGAVALTLRLFGRKGSTEIRPAAGNDHPTTSEPSLHRQHAGRKPGRGRTAAIREPKPGRSGAEAGPKPTRSGSRRCRPRHLVVDGVATATGGL